VNAATDKAKSVPIGESALSATLYAGALVFVCSAGVQIGQFTPILWRKLSDLAWIPAWLARQSTRQWFHERLTLVYA
jgi:hypothetical protein